MNNRQELQREYANRARSFGLNVDCPMDGVFNSEIAIVSEAPGENEVRQKLPLVGGSGQFLWQVLKKYDITRQHVYITNVIKRQVSLSAKKDVRDPVGKVELQNWQDLIKWELAQLPNLRYILILGNYALEALTTEKGITNWRGTVMDVQIGDRTVKAIIANNPAAILREPKLEVVFRFDVNKLNLVRENKYNVPEITAHINPSFNEAMSWMDKMQDEKLPVSFDIETISNETACLGLANSTTEGMCINLRQLDKNYFSTAEEVALTRRMQQLLGDKDVRLVAQNAMFDSYWLWYKDRIKVDHVWFDTMLAHHTLYSTLPHNLGFLTSQYTNHPFYKDEGKGWKESSNPHAIDKFWTYNVKDACITMAVCNGLQNELRSAKMEDFFFNHVMRLQPHLVRMTVMGLQIDTVLKHQIAEELREQVAILAEEFQTLVKAATGEQDIYINPRSPAQLADLFFRRLRLLGRGTSTDATNRGRMIDNPRTPEQARKMLKKLDEYKTEDKFLNTYAEIQTGIDGRIRCEYKQTGTQSAPGRLSSAKVMWGEGMNLQNQPERAHPMFTADEGYAFGYFDLAQAEARVVGWEAQIEKWMAQFEKARIDGQYDCHRALASEMWNMPYDEVPKKDRNEDGSTTLRFIAKRCRHGLNYRMGPDRLAQTTGLPMHEAERAYMLYHRATPELKKWWDVITQEVVKNRMLYNCMGRRLVFMERLSEESLESVVAFKPQSTIGDKVCQVIYKSESDPEWPVHSKITRLNRNMQVPEARMALNIHDALICLAPHEKVKTCLKIMKKYAEEPLIIHGNELIIPADCKVSQPDDKGVHRWSNLKAVEIEL